MSATVAPTMSPERELPVVQPIAEPAERADAARNRSKVLAAAERLIAERGAACLTMDAVAAEAGVGKGTLFRRFGDAAGLASAVLSERTRRFQDAIIRGPAPLGPGAPPIERLIAFGRHYIEAHGPQLDLLLMGERAGARYRQAPYAFWHLHISMLVREANPELDDTYIADALLAALRADLIAFLERQREWPCERIIAGWTQLVRRLLDSRE